MTADIIKFPEKLKSTYELDTSTNIDFSNIKGIPVENPKCRKDYLEICKQFLAPEDYQDILCGIMDREHYDALEAPLRKLIDCYFTFEM